MENDYSSPPPPTFFSALKFDFLIFVVFRCITCLTNWFSIDPTGNYTTWEAFVTQQTALWKKMVENLVHFNKEYSVMVV